MEDKQFSSKVLSLGEVAQYLRVHQSTVYRLLKRRELPAFKVGREWRVDIETLERWCSNKEAAMSSMFRKAITANGAAK